VGFVERVQPVAVWLFAQLDSRPN